MYRAAPPPSLVAQALRARLVNASADDAALVAWPRGLVHRAGVDACYWELLASVPAKHLAH